MIAPCASDKLAVVALSNLSDLSDHSVDGLGASVVAVAADLRCPPDATLASSSGGDFINLS